MYLDAETETPSKVLLDPLTRRSLNNEIYKRSPEVEAQILEALQLEESLLLDRVGISDFQASGYLKEEGVIYLIRRFKAEGKSELVNDLLNRFAQRIKLPIHKQISKIIHREYVEDACQDVLIEAIQKITDLSSDKADFAQVRFKLWLDKVTLNTLRPHFKNQTQDRCSESDIEVNESRQSVLPSTEEALIDLETHKLLLKMAYRLLDDLSEKERAAFLLRNFVGWEIENQDPSIMTISRYFDRSPRTISNWLRAAEDKLQRARGDQQ